MGRKFVIADPATCIGCKTCMAACFHRHDVPNDVAVPRLTLVTTRTISAPVGCHHCAEAPCVDACPTGCLFTDDEHVGVHPDKCIGCRNCVLACPVSWTHSRWQLSSGVRVSGARLKIRCPAAADCGGSTSTEPAGAADAPGREAVHLPLETRQTHSPSPVRVRGAESCTSSSAAGAAMAFQSNSNI